MDRPKSACEWRCVKCGSLLGVEEGGKLHLKYKAASFTVQGVVEAVCRRCGGTCTRRTDGVPDTESAVA